MLSLHTHMLLHIQGCLSCANPPVHLPSLPPSPPPPRLRRQEARYAEGVRRFDFDAGLAPYDLAGAAAWHALTCFVDAPLLARLLPPAGGGEVSAMAEALDPELAGAPRTAAERALEAHLRDGREALQRRRAKQQQQQQQQQQQEAGAAMETDGDAAATVAATGEPSKPSTSQPAAAAAPADDPLAGRPPRWGRARYTRLPRVVRAPPGATAAELTALNRDRTAALEQAAAATGDASGRALLGELQVAFAAFVLGQSLEGFLQWKALVALFLGCEAAPLGRRHADLFAAFLAAVRQQLAFGLGGGGGGGEAGGQQHNGSGGGDDAPCALGVPLVEELLPDSFLRRRFAAFFELLAEAGGAGVPPQVARQAAELEALLRARLKWDFRVRELRAEGGGGDGSGDGDDNAEDDDEDGPVVVELTDEQRRAAGLEPL